VKRHTALVVEIVRRTPHPALCEHVTRGYSAYRERGTPLRRAELPHAGIVLIVNLGPKIEVDGASFGSFVAGLHDRPAITEHHGEQAGVQLNLTPLGARRLLGMPMRELTRTVVGVEDVLGRDGVELTERMADATAWSDRLALLDAFLLRRLRASEPVRPDVAYTWSRLAGAHGDVAIGRLCRELGCSRRHLAARFGEEVGLGPKALARILRFDRAAGLLGDGHQAATVAAACGYADQSHLARDFRSLAHATPAAVAASLAGAPVTNVQDPEARAA